MTQLGDGKKHLLPKVKDSPDKVTIAREDVVVAEDMIAEVIQAKHTW